MDLSSEAVGREFVRQYYTLLNRAPNHLYRFYSNDSSFVHGDLNSSGCEIVAAVGLKEINRRIQELEFLDCHVKISKVHSQATLGNGLVVQVTGELSNSGKPMRRFTQTLVLAAQGQKTFYILNDIFRYQDLGFPNEEQGETGLAESAKQESEDGRSETAVFHSSPPKPQIHAGMQPFINGIQISHASDITTKPDPDINVKKQYACVAKSVKVGGSDPPRKLSVPPPPMTNPRNEDRSVVNSTTSAPSVSPNIMSSGRQQYHRIYKQTTHSQQHQKRSYWPDSHQLFVGNIPKQASQPKLRSIFENFGKVVGLYIHYKRNDYGKGPQIQINSNRVPNYGFVTFEDPIAVSKVLRAPPIGYPDGKGLKLNIKPKKNRPRAPDKENMRSSKGGQQRCRGGSGRVMRDQHGGFSRSSGNDGGGRSGMRHPANVRSSNYQSR